MKHFFAFLALLTLSLPCLAQWQPANGPVTNTASFFDGGKYVFATTSDGLYRSGDFGATWEIVEALPRHYSYESVTKSPDSSQIVVIAYDALCQCACLFRSTDQGETWEKISTPGFADGISSLYVGDQGYLLAAVNRRYKSDTGWEYSVWESRDGGSTWQESPLNALYESSKGDFQQFGDKIWGRTGKRIFRGNLDGTEWEEVFISPDSLTLHGYFVYDKIVMVFHYTPSAAYAYRSVDGGLIWQPIKLAQISPLFSGGSEIQRHSNILLSMGSDRGFDTRFVRSDDGGVTWEEYLTDSTRYSGNFLLKWPYVIAHKPGAGVVRSSDLGQHFEPMHERLNYASIPDRMARLGDWLYMTNADSYDSKEGVVKYNLTNGIWHTSPQPPFGDRAFFSNNDLFVLDGRIFHTHFLPSSIYRSDDGGLSWKDCNLYDSQLHRLIRANHLFTVKNSLFAFLDDRIGSNSHSFYRTDDYGTTWQSVTPQTCAGWGVSMAGNVGDVIFAAKPSSSCLHRSDDLGDTWTEIAVPAIPVHTDTGLVYISGMEPTGKRILLTMRRWERQQADFFYFVSNDLGNSWQPCEMPLLHTRKFSFDTHISSFEVGAYTLQSFYNDGVLLSSDGGLHWQKFNEGLSANDVLDLEADQQYLYASVWGHGLWKRPLADLDKATIPQPSPPPLDISIGPNPCEGTLRILATERTESGRLEWFDMQGRLLLTQPVDFICDQAIIDIPLQDGFYTYRLNTPSGQATGKLIVKR